MGWVHGPWMVQPGFKPSYRHATQRGHAVHHRVSRVSLRLALLPSASLDKARSLHRIGTLGASLPPWTKRNLPLRVFVHLLVFVSGTLGGETISP